MRRLEPKASELVGGLQVALGLLVSMRWMFQIESIGRLIPGSATMGIVTPLLFVAIGAAFFAISRPERVRVGSRRLLTGYAVALSALPLAYLIENFTGADLGVDFVRAGAAVVAGNPHPGRMSPNASFGFLLTGLAIWLLGQPATRARHLLYTACNVGVAIIGLCALTGHLVGLEALYRFAEFNAMVPATAFGLSVGAAGLWMLRQDDASVVAGATSGSERSIRLRSLAVLALVALGAGVAGFAVLRETFEQSVSQNMLLSATTNAKSLANTIEASLWFPRTAATRIPIRTALQTLSTSPADSGATESLRKIAASFLPAGVTGLEFYGAGGELVASAGRIDLPRAQARHHLTIQGTAQGLRAVLGWQDGYLLSTDVDVVVDGRVVGRVVGEQRLKLFDDLLAEARSANETADAALCSREGDRVLFAPTRFRPAAFDVPMFNAAGQPSRPVVRGLLGQRGVEFAKDLRGIHVVSAYAPVGDYGLAFAVKAEIATLYAPLRPRLGLLALAIAAIIALGFYAQQTQVRPLLKQLIASQNRIRAILEEQSELVSLAKPDGELTYVNPAYARHFGRLPEDMVGSNLFDYVEPADLDIVRATVSEVLRSGIAARSENRMVERDGAERWLAWTNAVQRDPSGVPLLHSVGRDITERKRAEFALRSSQAFLARTGRVAGVGGWELDLGSGRLTWSDETRRLDTAIQFYAPEAREVIEAAVKIATTDGTPWDLELPFVTATGRPIWVRAQGEAEFEEGMPIRLVGAFQDITERKRLQSRLAESERFIRKISDSLPVRIAYIDGDGRYAFVNQAHCRSFRPRWTATSSASSSTKSSAASCGASRAGSSLTSRTMAACGACSPPASTSPTAAAPSARYAN
jgi:PAS domain S-box-containing protein